MRRPKNYLWFLFAVVIIVSGVAQVNAAVTNNIEFKFKIRSYQANRYSDERERSTKNPKCAWMVDFRKSNEDAHGKKCKTRFWLDRSNFWGIGEQASDDHDILEGSGRKFYPSTKKGTQCTVCLGAENNNYNAKTYTASGFWDEETAVILK